MAKHCLLSVSLHDEINENCEKVWKKLSKTDVASIQKMEAVTKLLSAYAVDESHQPNAFNSSLLPRYCKAMITVTNKNTYEMMMVLTRPAPVTKLNNWPRVSRKAEEFTPAGKQCLHHLHEQVKLRLPALSAVQCLYVALLGPATEKFAVNLLNGNGLYGYTKELQKMKHCSV